MNRKRIRQMNTALLRRLTGRPTAEYFSGQPLLERLESENYIQRFAPLYDGTRLRCGDVLELCRPELTELSGGEPEGGWLHFAYDFARRQLFPEKEAPAAYDAGAVFFLSLLQVLFTAEREKLPFDPAWDFDFLSETEAADCACGASYRQMLRQWKREYVYEMMRLGLEVTPYRTLEHIAGVHHIALTCGRALRRSGTVVDLALVSGSAAGHDLGKFGCHPGERVAYLHYYYTDLWFRRHRLTDIGHVAANHSVWDLEPEYLSAEALLLIYADFRVKQTHDPKGHEITHISSLAEAFDVILNKLDDVDGEKRRRYTRVYARLQDFEAYMIRRGVDVTMQGADTQPLPEQAVALMEDAEVLESLTMQCVAYRAAELFLPAGSGPWRDQLAAAAGLSGGVRVLLPVSAHSTEGADAGLSL